MSEQLNIIEKQDRLGFIRCRMEQLRVGDVFRMFENEGDTEFVGGCMWKVISTPYPNKDGVYTVDVDRVEQS